MAGIPCGRRFFAVLLVPLALALLQGPALAAYLIYHDGQAHIGKVSRQHDGSFIVPRPGKDGLLITPDKVAWFSDADSVAAVIEEWKGALGREKSSEPGPGWLSLAKFCLFQGLPIEALEAATHWGTPRKLEAAATKRFVFLYRTRVDTFRTASTHLEAAIDWFQDEYPPAPGARPGCMVFILPDEATANALGRPKPVPGAIAWYLAPAKELVLLDWSRSSLRATMAHLSRGAAQHYLRNVYLANLIVERSWILDGMSNYFQALTFRGGKALGVRGRDRDLLDRIRINLKAGTHIPLERFFKFGYQDVMTGDPYNVYQAQAWSMAWYLLEPQGRKETDDLLGRFLDRLRKLEDEEKAWAETFGGHDLERLEQGWARSVAR